MIVTRTVAGACALSLVDAKVHLRVDHTEEDTLITSLAQAAHNVVSEAIGRVLTAETWTVALPGASGDLALPVRPVLTVESIAYFDGDDMPQTASVSDFYLFKDPDRPSMRPKDGKAWPSVRRRDDAMTITLTAGMASVPDELAAAMKLLVGHWYQNREAASEKALSDAPMAVQMILDLHRDRWVAA